MINILFSMLGPALEGDQLDYFSQFGQWALLNSRDGRLLFDAVAPAESVPVVQQALTAMGRDPVIIGGWTHNGTQALPLNEPAWLDVAPDDVNDVDTENPTLTRPTAFSEIHRWAGWHPKAH